MALEAGRAYTFVDAVFFIDKIPTLEVASFSVTVTQEKQNNYTTGKQATSRGYGREQYEASITLTLGEAYNLIGRSPGNNPLALTPFTVQKTDVPIGGIPKTVTLKNCDFLSFSIDQSTGDLETLVEFPLLPGSVVIE